MSRKKRRLGRLENAYLLQAGGTLTSEHTYIKRRADAELLAALRNHEYCYVFATRQIGKSSLRLQMQKQLRKLEYRCTSLSLDKIGTDITAEQFYCSFLYEICKGLGLEKDISALWEEYPQHFSQVQKFVAFFVHELASETIQYNTSYVVFIDEIDTLLSTKINRDDFFGAIRALYNLRDDEPGLKRIAFCLLGVAAPGDLMSDTARTPFNIGRSVSLYDFTRSELDGFRHSLRLIGEKPEHVLDEIFAWTSGHPYMTQKVCVALYERQAAGLAIDVYEVVRATFLLDGRYREDNLQYVEKRIDNNADSISVLMLYQRILTENEVPVQSGDLAQIELVLCGLAREQVQPSGRRVLCRRNTVYTHVFDENWVREKTVKRTFYQSYLRWNQNKRSPAFLLREVEYTNFKNWAQDNRHIIKPEEREFLAACQEYQNQAQIVDAHYQKALSEAADERKTRMLAEERNQRSRLTIVTLAGLGVLLGLFAIFYYQSYREVQLANGSEEQARNKAEAALYSQTSLRAALQLGQVGGAASKSLIDSLGVIVTKKGSKGELVLGDENLQKFDRTNANLWHGLVAAAQNPSVKSYLPLQCSDHIYDAVILPSPAFATDTAGPRGLVISAISGGKVAAWDLFPKHLRWESRPPMHSNDISVIAVSQNGQYLFTGSHDQFAKVWELGSGREQPSEPLIAAEQNGAIIALAVNREASLFATADLSGMIKIYNRQSKAAIHSFSIKTKPAETHVVVSSMSFSPDDKYILFISDHKILEVWPLDGTAPLFRWSPAYANVQLIKGTFPQNSTNQIKVLDSVGNLITWSELKPTNITDTQTLLGHSAAIIEADISSDGEIVATISGDGSARVWDAHTGREQARYETYDSRLRKVTLSADKQYLGVTGTRGPSWGSQGGAGESFVQFWSLDILKDQLRNLLPMHRTGLFSADGKRLVVVNDHKSVEVWDWSEKSRMQTFPLVDVGPIDGLDISSDDEYLVVNARNKIHIYSMSQGQEFDKPSLGDIKIRHSRLLHSSSCPNGLCAVTTLDDGTVRIHDYFTGKALRKFSMAGVFLAVPTNDESQLIALGNNGSMFLYDRNAEHVIHTFENAYNASKDGRALISVSRTQPLVALVSRKNEIKVFDTSSRQQITTLRRETSVDVTALSFSASGENLVAGYQDGESMIWNTRTAIAYLPLFPHRDAVLSAVYTSDDRKIITTGYDGAIHVHMTDRGEYFRVGCELLQQFIYSARISVSTEDSSFQLVRTACGLRP